MKYVSTRGTAPTLGFADVLLAGLASDGGLYVPESWPELPPSETLDSAATYAAAAAMIIQPFVGDDIAPDELRAMCEAAYGGEPPGEPTPCDDAFVSTAEPAEQAKRDGEGASGQTVPHKSSGAFRHDAVVPLVQIDHHQWVAELFHGPTLSFKDVALQLVGRLFDHVLGQRGERVTIVGATSGDTGSAAIEAVRDCAHVDIVILYPNGGPSDVQRRQMTTVDTPNVRAIAVDGTFDDCQDLVKAMFNDAPFREGMGLSAVNSINWARVMAQTVYYVTTARALRRPITACVPTGNFGNIFAGWVATQMGATVADFIVASNANDILTRFVNEGDMTMRPVVPTTSPSMDIQVSSNFERLLFEMNERQGARTAEQLIRFRETGRLEIAADVRERWIDGRFRAARFDDVAVATEIGRVYESSGMLIDPHTATGTAAAHALAGDHPVVTMATAHPAKFPDAVEHATGVRPALPEHLADLFDRPEHTELLANDLAVVEDYVTATFHR